MGLSVKCALSEDLFAGVGRSALVEAGPALLTIGVAPCRSGDRAQSLQGLLRTGRLVVGHLRADQRPAATDAFGVDVGVRLALPGMSQGADEAARYAACGRAHARADRRRQQPSGGDHRAKSWNRQQAQACEQAADAADHCPGRRALPSVVARVVSGGMTVAVLMVTPMIVRIVGVVAD